MPDNTTIPPPGSDAALDLGCTCPVLDNGHGLGILGDGERFGWFYTVGCPVHTDDLEKHTTRRELAARREEERH